MEDLTSYAGFPLFLNTDLCQMETPDDIRFTRETRYQFQMKDVLLQPNALPPHAEIYWNFVLHSAGQYDLHFKSRHLVFCLVLLPSLQIGNEFVRTHGHYHSAIPGSQIGYPEVYTHYYGRLYLYMQRRSPSSTAELLDDCLIYQMIPGRSIMIPPGYAHILINPSNSPVLMGGLYSLDAFHDYGPIRKMRGAAYYLVNDGGEETFQQNPHYQSCPPLRTLVELSGTCFAPPEPNRPLWRSFIEHPGRYKFIFDPEAAKLQFLPEDQRL